MNSVRESAEKGGADPRERLSRARRAGLGDGTLLAGNSLCKAVSWMGGRACSGRAVCVRLEGRAGVRARGGGGGGCAKLGHGGNPSESVGERRCVFTLVFNRGSQGSMGRMGHGA